jgi:hypothetical protein
MSQNTMPLIFLILILTGCATDGRYQCETHGDLTECNEL